MRKNKKIILIISGLFLLVLFYVMSTDSINAKDENGQTALIRAVTENKGIETLNALLRSGADVNARDKDGMTALIWAIRNGNDLEVVNVLIEGGADVNARDKSGREVLLWAAIVPYENPEVVAALLKAGAGRRYPAR
jgi:ankyrin repeat protein